MRKTIVFTLILTAFFFIIAQEKPEKKDSETKIEELAEETWHLVLRELKRSDLLFEKKMNLLMDFSEKVPKISKFNVEAEYFLKNINNSPERLTHLLNKEKYMTKTEWFAASFVGGNYGLGFSLSFFTVRWSNFFWEVIRIQFTMLMPLDTHSITGKTMIGIAAFFGYANQDELRVSIGLSGGMAEHRILTMDKDDDSNEVFEMLFIPFEVSYVHHLKLNFAIQTGITFDFPIFSMSSSQVYIPNISAFVGFRI